MTGALLVDSDFKAILAGVSGATVQQGSVDEVAAQARFVSSGLPVGSLAMCSRTPKTIVTSPEVKEGGRIFIF
jgi:hypothetical protein